VAAGRWTRRRLQIGANRLWRTPKIRRSGALVPLLE
jgi:hypothetical protein